MSLPSTLSNPWATQFRASLFADEDSPLDALGEAVESLGFGWLEGYMAQIFESGEACEGEGGSHDEEHVPALGDLIKTPSRKKGTIAKKTRAKAAADKDKVNKLAALNKKNASEDQPIARSKGDLFAPITLAGPLPSSSVTSAPTSTAAITVATVASQTPSRARAVKLVATSPFPKPLSPSKHPLPSSVATSPFRPPLSPHNSSHTNVLRAVSPLANRSSAKGEENASSLIQRLVGSSKKGGEHDEREEQENAEREVVVPVVKKKADVKASKAKAGGKKKKEKIAVQEEKEEGREPEELAIVDTPEMEESISQQPEGELDQGEEEEILQGPAEPEIIETPSAAPIPSELQLNQQPAQSTKTSTHEFSPPSAALRPIEEPQVAPFSSPSKPVVEQEIVRRDASNAGELEEQVEEREEEAASPVEPDAVPLQPKPTDVQAEIEVDEEEMEDGEIVESTLDEIDPTDEEDTLEAPRPDTSLATEPEEEEEIEAEDQEFAAPRSPVKPLSSSSSSTATKMPTPVPFPIASSPFAPKQKEEPIQREDGEVEEEDVQLGEEQEDVELSQQEQVDEEEEELMPADEEADISANRSQSPVILDEEALLKEEAEKAALAAAGLVPSVSVKALDETTDLAQSTASNASDTLSTNDLADSQTKQPESVAIPLSQPAELASLTTSTSSAASDHPVQPAAQPTPPQPVKPARPVRSSWLNKALGGGAAASSADSADQPGGLRKSHGAALVAASREREKEHQLQAAASSASASSSMMPPPRLSTALKRKSGEGIDAPAGDVDLDSTRSTKLPKLSDPASHPLSVTLPKTTNSRSTILFSPPPAATASLHADNQNGIDRVRKAVEELSAKAARSRGLSSMGPGGFGGSAAQLPYIPRDSSVPATRLPGVGVPATTAAAIVAEAAAAEVITPQEAVAIESELQTVASPPLIDARPDRMDDVDDYEEEQLPSLPSLPTSPRRSFNADEDDYPEESSAFPSSLASLVDQIDDQLAEPIPPPPAPVTVKKQPAKNLSPPVSRPRTPPTPAVAADEIPLGSTTPAASPPPAPLVAATIPKSSKVANLAQSFAGPSSTIEKGDLTLEDLEVPPKKTANKKAAVLSGGKGKGKKVDEDDLHDDQMEGDEEELVEVDDPKPKTTRVTRAGLNSSLSQSTSNGLASSTSNARLGASTSGQPSIYAQGSTFAAKALGKSAKAGPVKSLQLAAEAQKKEVAQKERKAAMSKLAEAQRMRALAEKQKEEKDRAEEEKRQRNAELAERKARAAELEKKRRDREEKERKAKELSKSQAAPDDDNSKKRKVAPDATSKSANDPKRFASSTSSKPQPSAVKQLAKPPASAGLPAKVVVPSFRHLPPQTANATASSSTSSANQQQQRSSNVLASSTIRMVGGGLGPPVRPSEVGKMGHQQQQQQQHRPSQAQGASVLAAQRQMLQNHINAQNEEVPGQSEAIELPDIKSEYSDSDDEDRPKSTAPQWAQSPEIRSALREQELHNPDEIFGPMRPLNMEETFRARAGKFRARSSSANWGGQDRLTPQEELEYARRMGFVSQAAQSGLRQAD